MLAAEDDARSLALSPQDVRDEVDEAVGCAALARVDVGGEKGPVRGVAPGAADLGVEHGGALMRLVGRLADLEVELVGEGVDGGADLLGGHNAGELCAGRVGAQAARDGAVGPAVARADGDDGLGGLAADADALGREACLFPWMVAGSRGGGEEG